MNRASNISIYIKNFFSLREMSQEQERAPRSKLLSFGHNMISGGLSGIAAKTISAPIERVKLLLQTQFINSSISVQYKGPIDCAKRVLKEEGFLSFWRGNMANVYRYFPQQAMTFGFKDQYRSYFVGTGTSGDASKDVSLRALHVHFTSTHPSYLRCLRW